MSEWISQVELTKRWGKSRQTAAEWARRPGCPKRNRAGKIEYQWPEFLEWWASERERAARDEATPVDSEQAKARKALADAKLAEYELAQAEGRLIDAQEGAQEFMRRIEPIRASMIAMPPKWAPLLMGKRTLTEMQAALETLGTHMLEGWSGSRNQD